jgi:hypothetical protein
MLQLRLLLLLAFSYVLQFATAVSTTATAGTL